MTEQKTYWIADPEGVKAKVSGAEARDHWVRVQGWTETTEPVGLEFQWVRNAEHGGKGAMNHDAAVLHEGLGWFPSGPPGYDEPVVEEPVSKSSPKSGAAGEQKEK